MADFEHTLIVAIVASIVSVFGFLGLTLTLALYWSSIARRFSPNRFAEPPSEKSWPSSSETTTQANLSIPSPVREPSPAVSSRLSKESPAKGSSSKESTSKESPSTESASESPSPQEPPKAVVKGSQSPSPSPPPATTSEEKSEEKPEEKPEDKSEEKAEEKS